MREVKPFTGTPPTRWIVRSSGTADVSDVPDPHADAAETEETKSAGLRRRFESGPTSLSTQLDVYNADEEPARARPCWISARPNGSIIDEGSGCEIDDATSDGKGQVATADAFG